MSVYLSVPPQPANLARATPHMLYKLTKNPPPPLCNNENKTRPPEMAQSFTKTNLSHALLYSPLT